jgi:hypothetical protein
MGALFVVVAIHTINSPVCCGIFAIWPQFAASDCCGTEFGTLPALVPDQEAGASARDCSWSRLGSNPGHDFAQVLCVTDCFLADVR